MVDHEQDRISHSPILKNTRKFTNTLLKWVSIKKACRKEATCPGTLQRCHHQTSDWNPALWTDKRQDFWHTLIYPMTRDVVCWHWVLHCKLVDPLDFKQLSEAYLSKISLVSSVPLAGLGCKMMASSESHPWFHTVSSWRFPPWDLSQLGDVDATCCIHFDEQPWQKWHPLWQLPVAKA